MAEKNKLRKSKDKSPEYQWFMILLKFVDIELQDITRYKRDNIAKTGDSSGYPSPEIKEELLSILDKAQKIIIKYFKRGEKRELEHIIKELIEQLSWIVKE